MFNYLIICCATRTHHCQALVAQRGVELGASKRMCYFPLNPQPSYLLIYSLYYITIYYILCVFFTPPITLIVLCDSIYFPWWSIRVDPYCN